MGQLSVIIIGGGIAGLSLGWHLQRLGCTVSIIERDTVGSGASRAATAYLEPRTGSSGLRQIEWAALRQ